MTPRQQATEAETQAIWDQAIKDAVAKSGPMPEDVARRLRERALAKRASQRRQRTAA
jgi:hypothetical protein